MREYITTTNLHGKLYIGNELFEEGVKCEYKDDVYSNNTMEGFFEVKKNIFNFNYKHADTFKFTDIDGRTITGKIRGKQIGKSYNTRFNKLMFRAKEYTQWVLYSDEKPVRALIYYDIPYISFLKRDKISSSGFDDNYIIKFQSEPIRVKTDDIEIEFF